LLLPFVLEIKSGFSEFDVLYRVDDCGTIGAGWIQF
jgi:hypothetical protein